MTWSFGKRYVAWKFENGRSMEETVNHVLEGFYGVPGTDFHGYRYTPEICQSHIKHCQQPWDASLMVMQRCQVIFKLQDSGDVLSEEQQSRMEAQQYLIFLGNVGHDDIFRDKGDTHFGGIVVIADFHENDSSDDSESKDYG